MNNEIIEELVKQIATLEKRIEYMETVEKNVFSTVRAGRFYSGYSASLADDAATSFTPVSNIGILLLSGRILDYADEVYLICNYRTAATVFCNAIVASSDCEVATGILTGADGVDGKVTVSAHSDGKIYIENRWGSAISYNYTLLGV